MSGLAQGREPVHEGGLVLEGGRRPTRIPIIEGTVGTVEWFYMWGKRNRLQLKNTLIVFHLFDTTDYLVSRISPIAPLLVDHFWPIRDTIESTVAVTGVEKKTLLKQTIILSLKRFRGPPM